MYKFITINAIRVMAGNLFTCQNPFTGYVCSLFHYGVGYNNKMSFNLLTQLTHMYSSNSVQSMSVC